MSCMNESSGEATVMLPAASYPRVVVQQSVQKVATSGVLQLQPAESHQLQTNIQTRQQLADVPTTSQVSAVDEVGLLAFLCCVDSNFRRGSSLKVGPLPAYAADKF